MSQNSLMNYMNSISSSKIDEKIHAAMVVIRNIPISEFYGETENRERNKKHLHSIVGKLHKFANDLDTNVYEGKTFVS